MGVNTKSITVTMTNKEFTELTRYAGHGNITPHELTLQLIRAYLAAKDQENENRRA